MKHYLSIADNPPDVICLQETLLTKNKQFKLHPYNIIRKDNDSEHKGRGILVAYRSHVDLTDLSVPAEENYIAFRVTTATTNFVIINTYVHPGQPFDFQVFSKYLQHHQKVILLGDFNARNKIWNCTDNNTHGINIEQFMDDHELTLLNYTRPTHIQRNTVSLIDLTIATSNIALNMSVEVLDDAMGSDHWPILIDVNLKQTEPSGTPTRYNTKKMPWATFYALLQSQENTTTPPQTVDEQYDELVATVTSICDALVPRKKRTTIRRIRALPFWNATCQTAVDNRKSAEKQYKKNPTMENQILYKRYKAIAQRTLRFQRRQYWTSFCTSLTPKSKIADIWKLAKRMNGQTQQQRQIQIEIDGRRITEPAEVANAFAVYYRDATDIVVHNPAFEAYKNNMEQLWRTQRYEPKQCMEALNDDFLMSELIKALQQTKNNSAPGEDHITYDIIKHLNDTYLSKLLNIYNKYWHSGTLHPSWKNSIVVPMLKKQDKTTDIASYRPISLTSVFSKVYERMITNRLYWVLESNKLLNSEQTGFRRYKNSTDQILRLQDAAVKSITTKKYTLAVFLDYTKAFDMLWISGLLHKLRSLGIHGHIYDYIENFLTNRTLRVKIGNHFSSTVTLRNGTPQGSVISPLLFIIMTNDFPTIGDRSTHTSLYADDSAIWKSSTNVNYLFQQMQATLDIITEWSKKWGFVVNGKKPFRCCSQQNYGSSVTR